MQQEERHTVHSVDAKEQQRQCSKCHPLLHAEVTSASTQCTQGNRQSYQLEKATNLKRKVRDTLPSK
jgi:hypothetical protein